METRLCRSCLTEFSADTVHFYKSLDKPGGLTYFCKPCHNRKSAVSTKKYRVNGGDSKMARNAYISKNGPIEPGMHIHHLDNDPSNNDPSNLVALTPVEHRRVHAGWRKEQDGWRKPCSRCKKVMHVSNFSEHIKGSGRYQSKCKDCANKYPPKVCPICDKEYIPCYPKQQTCSTKCSGVLRSSRESRRA